MVAETLANTGRQEHLHFELEYRLQDSEGSYRWCHVTMHAVYNDHNELSHHHGYLLDVTDRKQAEEQIEFQAYYDPLTRLFNRRLLLNRLEKDLAKSIRQGGYGAILSFDLDRFKAINDTLGHAAGDDILQQVARRLTGSLRQDDTAARLGGDEFVVLLSEIHPEPEHAAIQARQVAEKVRRDISAPFEVAGHQLHLSSSIGITLFPEEHHQTAEDLLKHADIAMYRAKESGRDNIEFFLPSMQQAAQERLLIEKDLRTALQEGQFELYCQPQVGTDDQLLGGEMLIRWNHPERGMVSPIEFIPVAEETGLIEEIGDWVIEQTCGHIDSWLKQAILAEHQHISINVSAYQFHQGNLVEKIEEALKRYDGEISHLTLELTETVVVADVEDTIDKMNKLKELGVEIALDDFGTGYSSLSYLQRLPLSTLKIDRSFVKDIDTDANDAAIVQTVISMARHLGLEVIAEGVETEQHKIFLQASGCQQFQGFLFSRPEPLEAFAERLEQSAASR
jgi:diguanylate cyclase (GGDEF)-like protein